MSGLFMRCRNQSLYFVILLLWCGGMGVLGQDDIRLANLPPAGQAAFARAVAELPEFDEDSVREEAEKLFKLHSIGDVVEVRIKTGSRGPFRGTFQSIGHTHAVIGGNRVPIQDIVPEDFAKLSPEESKKMTGLYIREKRREYMAERFRAENELIQVTRDKYPNAPDDEIAEMFSEIFEVRRRSQMIGAFGGLFEKSLPVPEGLDHSSFLASVTDKYIALNPSLRLELGKIRCLEDEKRFSSEDRGKFAEREKKAVEEARRREQERIAEEKKIKLERLRVAAVGHAWSGVPLPARRTSSRPSAGGWGETPKPSKTIVPPLHVNLRGVWMAWGESKGSYSNPRVYESPQRFAFATSDSITLAGNRKASIVSIETIKRYGAPDAMLINLDNNSSLLLSRESGQEFTLLQILNVRSWGGFEEVGKRLITVGEFN